MHEEDAGMGWKHTGMTITNNYQGRDIRGNQTFISLFVQQFAHDCFVLIESPIEKYIFTYHHLIFNCFDYDHTTPISILLFSVHLSFPPLPFPFHPSLLSLLSSYFFDFCPCLVLLSLLLQIGGMVSLRSVGTEDWQCPSSALLLIMSTCMHYY